MESKKNSTKKVAVNTSSGAEKVEKIEEKRTTMPEKTAKNVKNSPSRKTVTKKSEVERKAKAENERAQLRAEAAKARAERKEAKRALRAEKAKSLKEKRLEARERRAERRLQAKERAAERKAAHAARKDMLKNETAVQRSERREREKNERIALRKQNAALRHELALKRKEARAEKRRLLAEERRHKREQRTKRREGRTPGFGGWLAAVISLGTVSLAMGAIITVGAMNLRATTAMMGAGYRGNLYEISELSENLNANLGKLRVATGAEEQRRLLIDVLVQSELMEGALERFPVDMATTNNIASFVNRTAAYARRGLDKVAEGQTLGEEEKASIAYMYSTNSAILSELTNLRDEMTDKDWEKLMKRGADGAASRGIENLNSNVIRTPSGIQDGPFSEHTEKVTNKGLAGGEKIDAAKAEELAGEYFSDRNVRSAECKGKTSAENMECFNVTLQDERGREIYAQISETGGKLIMFTSYEDCAAKNYSKADCVAIAEEFLSSLGIENMRPVWLQENGASASVNFVYEQDDVICYSDMIVVKVCETKGKVIGMEAMPYYLNHGERTMPAAKISEAKAADALGDLVPKTARLALIPMNGEEVLTYEFSGEYDGTEYFVYVDATTGNEVQAYRVLDTAQGRALR